MPKYLVDVESRGSLDLRFPLSRHLVVAQRINATTCPDFRKSGNEITSEHYYYSRLQSQSRCSTAVDAMSYEPIAWNIERERYSAES